MLLEFEGGTLVDAKGNTEGPTGGFEWKRVRAFQNSTITQIA